MRTIAERAQAMPASGIREIVNLAIGRPDVIRLEIGEPDFATPAHIVAGAMRGIAEGFTRYTQSAGLLSLRELLAEKSSRQVGLPLGPDHVTVAAGGVQAMYAVLLSLVGPGDEVLLPDPAWPNYEMASLVLGATPVRYPLHLSDGFVPRLEEIEQRITPRTRILIVNSPSNPTGAVFPRATVEALADLARRHDIWLMTDEVYGEMLFEGEHVSPLPLEPDRTILINSFSKTYAMTGWRVGYAVTANRALAQTLAKVQEPQISSVAGPCQKAAEAALTGPQDDVAHMRDSYRERRDSVLEVLERHGQLAYRPSGAFYIMLDISPSGLDGRTFALRLLEEEKVAVAPGTAFGEVAQQQVRVSLASAKEMLLEGVERACRTVERLAQERPSMAAAR